MEKESYKKQVALLLGILPEAAKEKCFALHGGTAINLFMRDLPRLSVDIDLTYVPVEDRTTSLANIGSALEKVKANIEKVITGVSVIHREETGKLFISAQGVEVKLEVNLVKRGVLGEPVEMPLCAKAQEDFEVFCAVRVVPAGQLYGGKICAALDRQHPRDLFDVKYLLENEGFSEQIKSGFLLSLLSGNRPMHEIINPNFQDHHSAFDNQFAGMSDESFSYKEYESVRLSLVQIIHKNLTKEDKEFLLSVKNLTPDWSAYNFSRFPAVVWKMRNLQKLKDDNPSKYRAQCNALKSVLDKL